MIKKFVALFTPLSLLILLTSCVSGTKSAQQNLNKYIEQIKNLDDELIDEIAKVTTEEKDNVNYKNLIKEMLKNLKIEVISVEKDKETKEIKAVVEMVTQKNDLLVEDYFSVIKQKSTERLFQGEEVGMEGLIDEGIKNMFETYKVSLDSLSSETNRVTIIYVKGNGNKWEMKNPEDFYNSLLGELFSKIRNFTENELGELVLKNYLQTLQNLSVADAAVLFGFPTNQDTSTLEVPVMFYNTMKFEITDKIQHDRYTDFKTELKIIDEELFFDYVTNHYVKYFKEANDNKKTPTNKEAQAKLNELYLDSLAVNRDNRKTKILKIKVTDDMKFENIDSIISALLKDTFEQMEKSALQIQDKISKIYD